MNIFKLKTFPFESINELVVHKFLGANMDMKLVVLFVVISFAAARDIELESFKPSSRSDQDLIDYGTLRITKVSKNNFTISGDFSLKKSIANEKRVEFYYSTLSCEISHELILTDRV